MSRRFKEVRGMVTAALSFVYLTVVLNTIQMLSALVYPISPKACRAINRWCARSIWGLWVIMAELQNGVKVRFVGDEIRWRENALLLPNHQSMADVMVLLSFGWRSGRLGDTKWFVKDVLKWIPGVGWGMKFLDCVFLKRNWADDKASIHRLFGKYQKDDIPVYLVSFLEGTRKTQAKHAAAQAFAKERGLYVPQQTLIPRTKGFIATMEGLGDHLDAVYDLTIGYVGGTPSLTDCFAARVSRVEVHVRRHPIASMPKGEAALKEWAFNRFREKDELMAQFAETQRFDAEVCAGDIDVLDWFRPEQRPRPRIADLRAR